MLVWTNKSLNCYYFAYGFQIRHALVCWNPLSIVKEKHLEPYTQHLK